MAAVANFVRKVLESALVKKIDLAHLGIDMNAETKDADGYTTFPLWCDKALISLTIRLPGLTLKEISINAKASLNGKGVGDVTSPYSPSKLKGSILEATMVDSRTRISESYLDDFIDLFRALILDKECTLNLTGKANIKVDFGPLGSHVIKGVCFSNDIPIRCLDSFPGFRCTLLELTRHAYPESSLPTPASSTLTIHSHPFTTISTTTTKTTCTADIFDQDALDYEQQFIKEATPHNLLFKGLCQAENNSQCTAVLGILNLEAWFNPKGPLAHLGSQRVGFCSIRKKTVWEQGLTTNIPFFMSLDLSLEVTTQFLEELANGDQVIETRGYKDPSENGLLSKVLLALQIKITIPQYAYAIPKTKVTVVPEKEP
ncbi:hypothetical protein BGW38_005603 [Lunasporangiospora selenospora]|uniref:Uncharacterized protein n=1 Tax=Lunasporangiospora selenospora TaxID=979761 RepID=A0A9P6FPP3_9FUNG|nr:hypothetical protein BGW38_005603 [Lunasporangiospora selenospora]